MFPVLNPVRGLWNAAARQSPLLHMHEIQQRSSEKGHRPEADPTSPEHKHVVGWHVQGRAVVIVNVVYLRAARSCNLEGAATS